MPWADCANAQAEFGFCCLHKPEDTLSHGEAHIEELINDRFYLSFFVAMHGFRESDFDNYSISYLSAHKSRPNVSVCVY